MNHAVTDVNIKCVDPYEPMTADDAFALAMLYQDYYDRGFVINKDSEEYDPSDPGTWLTLSDVAHNLCRLSRYHDASWVYLISGLLWGDPNVYSWLATFVSLDGLDLDWSGGKDDNVHKLERIHSLVMAELTRAPKIA